MATDEKGLPEPVPATPARPGETGAEVMQVLTRTHRAIGVAIADGSELHARIVVSAADPKRTLTTLVDPVEIGLR